MRDDMLSGASCNASLIAAIETPSVIPSVGVPEGGLKRASFKWLSHQRECWPSKKLFPLLVKCPSTGGTEPITVVVVGHHPKWRHSTRSSVDRADHAQIFLLP